MNSNFEQQLRQLYPDQQYLTLNNWMSLSPAIDVFNLAELTLPGAHNAGVDKKATYRLPGVSHWAACQTNSFYYQLTRGARALDLRLEYDIASNGVGTFWFHHNGYRSSRSLENLITNVIRFLQENPDEFILLDFHGLEPGGRSFDHQEFNRMLVTHLGERMIPVANARLTLAQLKQRNRLQRVMVAAPFDAAFDRSLFHDYISHQWRGIGATSADELKEYLTYVMASPPARYRPWSLSATSYHGLLGPVNISHYLNEWFDPNASPWATHCSIINADFFETSDLVVNCWLANMIKAGALNE